MSPPVLGAKRALVYGALLCTWSQGRFRAGAVRDFRGQPADTALRVCALSYEENVGTPVQIDKVQEIAGGEEVSRERVLVNRVLAGMDSPHPLLVLPSALTCAICCTCSARVQKLLVRTEL